MTLAGRLLWAFVVCQVPAVRVAALEEPVTSASASSPMPPAKPAPPYTYWAEQVPRYFVSADVAVGAFNRARLAVGYGRPYFIWGGLEVQAATTTEFGTVLIGPRFDALLVNVSFDVRGSFAYAREQPLRRASYASFDAEGTPGVPNHYGSLDAWLWGYVPTGPLPLLGYWEVGATYLLADPAPYAVFEEYMRFTLNGRAALMARSLISVKLVGERLLIGPAVDVVLSPERAALLRVGGGASYQFTPHLALSVLLTVPVISPDALDWYTQSWGIGRLSYSWASGEPRPGW
jgi:hypothetical protein